MEQHPVPQNVTTFQFRLIGDMTLKQFGYLAGGAILAYTFYKLPLPLFLNWPFAILFGIGGFGFAFVPIEERPMDVWVLSFFKSIYSPTQYVWDKKATQPLAAPPATQPATQPQPKTDILQSIFTPQPAILTQKKSKNLLDALFEFLMPRPPTKPVATPVQTQLPSTIPVKMDFAPPPTVKPRPPEPSALQAQVAKLQEERDKMEAELARLRVQQAPIPQKPTGAYIATPAAKQGPSVRIITPDRAVKAGLPRLTTFANVVTGIIKDGDQNLLPGVLVTVKDKDGVPLRALKTNRLGQFAASTPLANGVYFIEIEDPRLRYTFDRAQITLNGSVVPALEIFAKSQKEITRAKLEKELFGDNK